MFWVEYMYFPDSWGNYVIVSFRFEENDTLADSLRRIVTYVGEATVKTILLSMIIKVSSETRNLLHSSLFDYTPPPNEVGVKENNQEARKL